MWNEKQLISIEIPQQAFNKPSAKRYGTIKKAPNTAWTGNLFEKQPTME